MPWRGWWSWRRPGGSSVTSFYSANWWNSGNWTLFSADDEPKQKPENTIRKRQPRSQILSNAKSTECPECGKEFSKNGDMLTHYRSLHKGIKYPCNQCLLSVQNVGKSILRMVICWHTTDLYIKVSNILVIRTSKDQTFTDTCHNICNNILYFSDLFNKYWTKRKLEIFYHILFSFLLTLDNAPTNILHNTMGWWVFTVYRRRGPSWRPRSSLLPPPPPV